MAANAMGNCAEEHNTEAPAPDDFSFEEKLYDGEADEDEIVMSFYLNLELCACCHPSIPEEQTYSIPVKDVDFPPPEC